MVAASVRRVAKRKAFDCEHSDWAPADTEFGTERSAEVAGSEGTAVGSVTAAKKAVGPVDSYLH